MKVLVFHLYSKEGVASTEGFLVGPKILFQSEFYVMYFLATERFL